jgi:SAM-dependent methyltransferase
MISLEYLKLLRLAELNRIARQFPPGARILELGAGTGVQALDLTRRGFDVAAIDLSSSQYANDQMFPVQAYDGRRIPFADSSFDVVFSSNVLEHIRDLSALHTEARRVLRPGGRCVHVMPTHVWKLSSALTAYPDAVVCGIAFLRGQLSFRHAARGIYSRLLRTHRHGERGSTFSEFWLFRPRWWRQHFEAHGFRIEHEEPMGLLYTGNMLFGERLSFDARAKLATILGSSTHLFAIRAKADL